MAIEIHDSILCDLCQNAGKGLILPGRSICLDCAWPCRNFQKNSMRSLIELAAKNSDNRFFQCVAEKFRSHLPVDERTKQR
jgi:hypothetical protein